MFDQASEQEPIRTKYATALDLIASGRSVRTALARLKLNRGEFYKLADSSPAFADQLARAMERRADRHAERIEALADKVERGQIAPDAARVAIDARKWTASKLRPKKYGDKIQVDQDLTMRVEVVDVAAQARARIVSQSVAVAQLLHKPDVE